VINAPSHWKTLSGPSNWFQLAFPPEWTAEERDGAWALRPNGSEGFLALNAVWLDSERATAGHGLPEIIKQFPATRNVQMLQGGEFPGLVDSRRGEACFSPPRTLWEKFWKRPAWRAWTMWLFRREALVLIVTLLHAGERDNELEALARMVLGTITLSDRPADPPEVFARRALELARRKFPLLAVELGDDFQLNMSGSRLNLFNFYRAYVQAPENFEKILLPAMSTVVQVQEWGEDQLSPPLAAVRDRLMPMLYPEQAWQERFPEFIGTPWVGGLAILYVVDEHNAYWYVRRELLSHWGLADDELHEIAITNLQAYFARRPMELAAAGTDEDLPSMFIPVRPDSYNASRLLSQDFVSNLRHALGGDVVVGVPGRDFFVGVSLKAEAIVHHVRDRVKEDFLRTDHPLTDRLLLLSADGVSELPDTPRA
jgi:hypothetical protein